jgi:hypothetical protein
VLPITELRALSAAGVGIDYYVGIRRWGMLSLFAEAESVYEVRPDGVALVVVRDLRGAPIGR